ncbi:MAG: hypothetical protein GX443_18890 [Deltaproteobacteria bacterium]|nr:hypothetical protein [Deltaproteobacteria bacterium]
MSNHQSDSAEKGKVGEGGRVNPAKAAFEEYRRRMASQAASGMQGNPGFPPPPPWRHSWNSYGQGIGGSGGPQGPPHPYPGSPRREAAAEGSLFAIVGKMLRLGVDLITAGLAGGMQLIQRFSGYGGSYGEGWGWDDPWCPYDECFCGDFPAHWGCGYGAHWCTPPWHLRGHPRCTPGVHNCW